MNLEYLFAAYTVIWACLGGYLLFLGARQRSVRNELERLRERLEERAGGNGNA